MDTIYNDNLLLIDVNQLDIHIILNNSIRKIVFNKNSRIIILACDWFLFQLIKGDDAMSEFWKLLTHKFESWKQLQNITIQTIHLDTFQCIATCTKRRREKETK